MNLSTQQRIAIRALADGEAPSSINSRTFDSLVRADLIKRLPRRNGLGFVFAYQWTLTPLGQSVHRDIMASGDGPEDLKAMFRF